MAFFKNFFKSIGDTISSIPQKIGSNIVRMGKAAKEGITNFVGKIGQMYQDFTGFTKSQDELKRQFDETMAQNKENFETTEARLNKELEYNKEVSDKNLELQQNQFDYQKQLNQTTMEREDTAIQRQMADAQAAGLSPLSVIGGSGSAATALQSAPAPQRDVSGINSITGQYVDLAKEYATLQNMARTKYSELRNGANMALMQMRSDAKYKALSAGNSLFNSVVNAKNSRINRAYVQEQIDASKAQREWMSKNGYRNQTLENAIIAYFKNKSKSVTTSNLVKDFLDMLPENKTSAPAPVPVDNSTKMDYGANPSQIKRDTRILNNNSVKNFMEHVENIRFHWTEQDASYVWRHSKTVENSMSLEDWINYTKHNGLPDWFLRSYNEIKEELRR